jgi:UDP-N-acetylmuramoyl-L-alanyl-D-glutamate--2,6-diaminopimelate ligase
MQVIRDAERLFIVDYAHTPDALIQVLQTLKRHVSHHLWAVFGCGGDRDRGKRPLMTQAALDHADIALITSDNPRTENPEQIFADMKAGIDFGQQAVHEIHDRREAIKFAVTNAQAGDIVVIAGKGHENYQEIDGVRHWFDDVVEVQSAIDSQHHNTDSAYPAQ